MLKSPENLGIIHFIGIGGIGMSGIAEILHQSGYQVQGSDLNTSNNTNRLEKIGIKIFIGQKKTNIINAKIIVISTAISETNEEFWLDTSNEVARKQFQKLRNDNNLEFLEYCKKNNFDIIPISTSSDFVKPIVNYLNNRDKK